MHLRKWMTTAWGFGLVRGRSRLHANRSCLWTSSTGSHTRAKGVITLCRLRRYAFELRQPCRAFLDMPGDVQGFSETKLKSACPDDTIYGIVRQHLPMRSSAADLIDQLDFDCNPMGWKTAQQRKKGSFYDFLCTEKEKHMSRVMLVRVGEFYEAFGIDAVLLVNFCGLNAMAGKARAGFPLKNIQQSLNALTEAGLTTAVYEETEAKSGKGKIKSRILAQVVSPHGAANYVYGASLRAESIDWKPSHSHIGIFVSARGSGRPAKTGDEKARGTNRADGSLQYTIFEASVDSMSIQISERLTEEACRAIVFASGSQQVLLGCASALTLDSLSQRLSSNFLSGIEISDITGVKPFGDGDAFLNKMLRNISEDLCRTDLTRSNFREISRKNGGSETGGQPLYAPTAEQLGLLPSTQVPDLVRALLPTAEAAPTARAFFRKWLMRPPPYAIADEMQELCLQLRQLNSALPPLQHTLCVDKLVSLISSRQANAPMFRDLNDMIKTLLIMLNEESESYQPLQKPLMSLMHFESGLGITMEDLNDILKETSEQINAFIQMNPAACYGDDENIKTTPLSRAIIQMRRHNEASFSTSVRRDATPEMEVAWDNVESTRVHLEVSCKNAFGFDSENMTDQHVFFDSLNNRIVSKKLPTSIDTEDKEEKDGNGKNNQEWILSPDRNGKPTPQRFSTKTIETARSEYISAALNAKNQAKATLQVLCDHIEAGNTTSQNCDQTEVFEDTQGLPDTSYLPACVSAIHAVDILYSASLHVREASRKDWGFPLLEPLSEISSSSGKVPEDREPLQLEGLWPYWMDRAESVPNNVELAGQWLVTGANMSGKSSLLRSVTAASLLANCGLAAPVKNNKIHGKCISFPRIDGFYLRTCTQDCPAENYSAFALESDDIRVLCRDLSSRSLATVDELGRGTSPRDGAALAGAFLEELDRRRCYSIFATHLHAELRSLPLDLPNTEFMRFKVDVQLNREIHSTVMIDATPSLDDFNWTYELEPGFITDSLALATAAKVGVPSAILNRAAELRSTAKTEWYTPRESGPESRQSDKEFIDTIHWQDTSTDTSNFDRTSLNKAVEVVLQANTLDENSVPLPSPICFEGGWTPPPAIAEGVACVYILRGKDRGNIYVGQTKLLAKRIKTHSQHRFRNEHFDVAVLPLNEGGRDAALRIESLGIRRLVKLGFPVISDADGRKSHSAIT